MIFSIANIRTYYRRADKLTAELSRFQRDYLSALSSCVHRPLVDPDDGASFDIPEKQHHIATLKSLANLMKSKNDRILGCAIPKLGMYQDTMRACEGTVFLFYLGQLFQAF